MCDLMKYLVTILIPDKNARTVKKPIFKYFILKYGLIKAFITDTGTDYKILIINDLCIYF